MIELPRSADVVIVGAGFAGAATAWALARSGVRDVVVLEREASLGRYASGRSAGLGRQLAEDDDTTALTVRGAALLRELPGVWRQTGGYLGFDDETQLAAYVARARRFGVPVERVDPRVIVERWPELAELAVAHGLFVPSDGVIDVRRLLELLAADARVVLGAEVQRAEAGRIVTSLGELRTRVVVDAAGAWAGAATGDPALEAFRRHVIVYESSPRPTTPWLWHLGEREVYLRGCDDGVLASPCDGAPCSPGHQEPDPSGDARMRELLGAGLGEARIARAWACQRTFTPDRRMRLGVDPSRPWLVWAVGLGGHGATASAAVGERVADAIVRTLSGS